MRMDNEHSVQRSRTPLKDSSPRSFVHGSQFNMHDNAGNDVKRKIIIDKPCHGA